MVTTTELYRSLGLGTLEPGDRFELLFSATHIEERRLPLPPELQELIGPHAELLDEQGLALAVENGPRGTCIRLPHKLDWSVGETAALWLEYRGEGRFCLVREGAPQASTAEAMDLDLALEVDPENVRAALGCDASAGTPQELDLVLRAARLSTQAGFDQLICLPLVREMEILEHQVRTARTVLRRFRGRALLCDEVGLGKTIEAGLVMSELALRGLARSVLILVPPSLIEQWQGELRRKFSLDFISHDDPVFRREGGGAWHQFDRIVASIHVAKREPHRSQIASRHWDLVVVDEAHHLCNRNTQLWKLASALHKQFMLLLTATPVQNNLEELFNLVTLLEPGLLSTARKFQQRFVDRRDKLTPRNVGELHALLAEVMVRNRRSTVGLQFTRRWARTDYVPPRPEEAELYQAVGNLVRRHLQRAVPEESGPAGKAAAQTKQGSRRKANQRCGLERLALLSLQMALGSSHQAAAATLSKLAEREDLAADERRELAELAEICGAQRVSSKLERLLALVQEFPDKLVVFTQFRATQELLWGALAEAGHEAAVFHGGLTRLAKEQAIQQFRGPARILLCTEAGSEGRNLQFAHGVCNFDLPWNPMKIEQRIGRLSRIGQTHDVYVFNLVSLGTIEAAILRLLEAKLNMFELVIGEIDMVLGNLEEEREFPDLVADLWAQSADDQEFARRMDELGNRLLAAKEAYVQQRTLEDRLFADMFAPDR